MLYNFSPNNWENRNKATQYIFITYLQDSVWHNRHVGELQYGESKSFQLEDYDFIPNDDTLVLLSLNTRFLDKICKELPKLQQPEVFNPMWRSTLGLFSKFTESSYQGEINPFPEKASLLTFGPFMQFGDSIENYVLLLNIESKPINRVSEVEIYNAKNKRLLKTQSIESNQINIVRLDNIGLDETDLPVIVCRDMAFIPLYFSTTKDGGFLSLEHSHPPSKFVVHGKRFNAQGYLKKLWFSQLKYK